LDRGIWAVFEVTTITSSAFAETAHDSLAIEILSTDTQIQLYKPSTKSRT